MTTVGLNIPISAAPPGSTGAAAPAESAGLDEIFSDIIAGLAAGTAETPAAEQGIPAASEGAIKPEAGEAGVDALIEQLLAFAAGAAAKDLSGETGASQEGAEPEKSDDGPIPAGKIEAPQLPPPPETKAVVVAPATAPTLPLLVAASEAPPLTLETLAAPAPIVPTLPGAQTLSSIPRAPAIAATATPPASGRIPESGTVDFPKAGTVDSRPVPKSQQASVELDVASDEPAEATRPAMQAGTPANPQRQQLLQQPLQQPLEQPLEQPLQQPLQQPAARPELREPVPAQLDRLLKAAPTSLSFLRFNQEGSSDGVTISPGHDPLAPLTLVQSSAPAFSAETIQPTTLQPVKLDVAASPEPADLGVEHQLDMAHEGEWLDRLAKDIAQSTGSDSQPLRFRLNPETLGSLRVEISQDRNGAAVRLTADTEAARAIIAEAQPRLIAEARAQGIRISEAHVDVGSHTASGDQRRQNGDFEEVPLRTARSLQERGEGDGNPTPGRSERYA